MNAYYRNAQIEGIPELPNGNMGEIVKKKLSALVDLPIYNNTSDVQAMHRLPVKREIEAQNL